MRRGQASLLAKEMAEVTPAHPEFGGKRMHSNSFGQFCDYERSHFVHQSLTFRDALAPGLGPALERHYEFKERYLCFETIPEILPERATHQA